jgi:hypothetical protein
LPELVWAFVFLVLFIPHLGGWVAWPFVYGISFAATIILVVRELRRPSYHGVAWHRINPQLPAWWSQQIGGGA